MKKHFLISIFLCFSLYTQAQESRSKTFIADSLEKYIQSGMEKWNIPALAVAIVKDGKTILLKGYGNTKAGGKEAVNEHTLFMIGSNTKAFTATTLALLQEEGKLSLEDKVQKWMPEFKLNDSYASKEATITDLLCHRLGFETFQGDFTYWSSNLSRAEVIKKMALVKAPYPFRTKWGYCNAAFLTAGEIIPRVTGKSWEESVKEKILLPLKMNRTLMLCKELKSAENAAAPYTLLEDKLTLLPIADIDNLAPAGSMSSSVYDMSLWLNAQINKGKVGEESILPFTALNAIRTPYSIQGVNPADKAASHFFLYGLGIGINDRKGRIVYSHTGGVDGYLSSVMFIPEEKLGIVVLTNTDQNNFFQALTYEIADAYLGLPYRNFSDLFYERNAAEKAEAKQKTDSLQKLISNKNKPSLPLTAYTGVYNNELYGDIEIKAEKKGLVIYFSNHPGMTAQLDFIKDQVFLCTYSNPTIGILEMPFKTEGEKATGLTLRVNDFVEFTPYEFVKK